jgi:hypothetical protein
MSVLAVYHYETEHDDQKEHRKVSAVATTIVDAAARRARWPPWCW